MNAPLVEIKDVSKRFAKRLDIAEKVAQKLGAGIREEIVHAVDEVNLIVKEGEVLGLVGESGCGKSTLGRVVAGIHAPSSGQLLFQGQDVATMSRADKKAATLAIQMIFQDPFASLNPRMRVEDIIGEAPQVHGVVSRSEASDYVDDIMKKVGLDPSLKRRYAHQFSGGQRQRIGIARALAVKPKFLVCDEAIAALDVSIQAQVINLFMDLREEFGLTYLFISHDLSVVEHIADRVAIMYLGRIVESASTEEIFSAPKHPYTKALLAEAPRLDQRKRDFAPIEGEIPSPLDPPKGCFFNPRCPHAQDLCRQEQPGLETFGDGHSVACHYWKTL
ncbi:ATP-binding cassette domain-containing protein [Labrenzia sp. R4_2]|uniref:ABC transporter ATP-binding protein n=1 Tax=Labrenzia sp. R4_2 TaxID=2821107 RepID=UPI001ADC0A54|nr:oligopeptide/dipeptide ABC transporter ATP-binding protein [Labrenzia sp. R4_2]MBO9420831.1 ATP-binding cassette domain-containing protein [Labrenzia sp. R4_2]